MVATGITMTFICFLFQIAKMDQKLDQCISLLNILLKSKLSPTLESLENDV